MAEKPKFFTDVHIPYAVVEQLREKDVDVLRCQDVGMERAADEALLDYATTNGRIMITCDSDFPDLHYEWLAAGKEHAGIIHCQAPELCKIKIILENVLLIYDDPDGKAQLRNDLWRVQK